jgi:hypothetical protein
MLNAQKEKILQNSTWIRFQNHFCKSGKIAIYFLQKSRKYGIVRLFFLISKVVWFEIFWMNFFAIFKGFEISIKHRVFFFLSNSLFFVWINCREIIPGRISVKNEPVILSPLLFVGAVSSSSKINVCSHVTVLLSWSIFFLCEFLGRWTRKLTLRRAQYQGKEKKFGQTLLCFFPSSSTE